MIMREEREKKVEAALQLARQVVEQANSPEKSSTPSSPELLAKITQMLSELGYSGGELQGEER